MKLIAKKFIAGVVICIMVLANVKAQNINVIAFGGNYSPGEFPGYPSNGNWSGYFTKTSGVIPAGTARIIISLVPEIPWTEESFSYPSNWTLNTSFTTTTNIVFDLTSDWTNASDDPIFEIPVRSNASRTSTAASAGLVLNARPGFNWQGTTNQTDNAQFTQVQVLPVPLPVTLTTFNASKEAQTSLLSWSTTEESNSEHFDIQHSVNAKSWTSIGTVKAQGESKALKKYTFTHEEPTEGENLYRLKMVDKDGTFAYSRIVSVVFDGVAGTNIYPNPARTFVNVTASQPISEVQLINLSGVTMMSKSFNGASKTEPWTFGTIIPGAYQVKITTKNGTVQYKKVIVTE